MKEEIITSALTELNQSRERCNLPTKEELLSATKENPIDWNAYNSMKNPSPIQSEESFNEQKIAVKVCTEAIDKYNNIFQKCMVKSCTIRGYAGSGKSWCMQYCLLYCYAKGLIGIPTSVMSRRSVFLGSKHIDNICCLPFKKNNLSPWQIAEQAICKLNRYPEKMNLLRSLDILFFDEIGQLPAEILSSMEITFRRIKNNSIFLVE